MPLDDSITVDSPVVGCDGGDGALGHPLVFLKIGPDREVVCPYCSRRFVLADGVAPAEAH